MRELLEKRLAELKDELESGKRIMAELDAKRTDIKATVLRISGAVQVLEELLDEDRESLRVPEIALTE